MNKITVKNIEINVTGIGDDDYVSLTVVGQTHLSGFVQNDLSNIDEATM